MKRFIILGAGISGLSVAWFLQKQNNIAITILEQSDRVGGLIRTIEKNGFLFELGPHSCRATSESIETLKLIEELGLEDEVITGHSSATQRYLYLNQQLTPLPRNIVSAVFSPLTRCLPKAMWRDWRTPPSEEMDESIHSFFSRRFGQSVADTFIDPLVSGIYAGDTRRLSIRSCFPSMHHWEQTYGSVLRGFLKRRRQTPSSPFIKKVRQAGLFSFQRGMETLPRRLGEKLNANIRVSCEAKQILHQPDGIEIIDHHGNRFKGDHLISTLPAHRLAALIAPHGIETSKQIAAIEHVSLVVISLGFHEAVLKHKGFGYLIPSKEQESILGVIWDSIVFPQQNRHEKETRLTIMLGGAHNPAACSLSDNDCIVLALESIRKHLGITAKPEVVHVHRVVKAIPQYFIGHHRIVEQMKTFTSGITCLGTSFCGVSINDCIAEAKRCAEK